MKTLILVAHPQLSESKINRTWKERLEKEASFTIHDLYAAYPDGKIHVEQEQELLLAHDRIVFQFPFYWYSTPALLKQWQDTVLTYGWAYGSEGNKLHGKEFMAVLSTGGPSQAYQPAGYNRFTMDEFLRPLEAMVHLTGMAFLPPFCLHGVRMLSDEEISHSAEQLVLHLKKSFELVQRG